MRRALLLVALLTLALADAARRPERSRLPPLRRCAEAGALRPRRGAARPARRATCRRHAHAADRVRALPAATQRPPVARHDGRRRGRARLLDDRQPRLLPRAARPADGPARPAARGPIAAPDTRARSTAARSARPSRTTSAAPGACARQLGSRVDFYGTHAAVDDLADVLDALALEQIDLYGDSYGSYFAQAFAVRHADAAALARARRDLPAAGHRPGVRRPRRGDLARAAARVRAAAELRGARRGSARRARAGSSNGCARSPVSGTGINTDGERIRVRVDEDSLVATGLSPATRNMPMYRDLLAAIRAFEAGDRAPLLRLLAENTLDPIAVRRCASFSEAPVPRRHLPRLPADVGPGRVARAAHGAARPARGRAAGGAASRRSRRPRGRRSSTRAPTACLRWPGPRGRRSAGATRRALSRRPHARAQRRPRQHHRLVGRAVVASRFPRSTFVELHNSIHVTALRRRDDCASRHRAPLHQDARAPATRAARSGSRRSAPSTSSRARRRTPSRPSSRPGDESRPAARRAAAVAAATVADAIQRWAVNYSGESRGLRGGRWSYTGRRHRRGSSSTARASPPTSR